jgi:hypothetical protein
MLGKLLLAGAAVMALAIPSVSTSTAHAGSFGFDISVHRGGTWGGYYHGGIIRHRHCEYKVFYRECGCDRWNCYGHYGCYDDAYRVASRLRFRGFQVRMGF